MKQEPVAWMELYYGEPNNLAWTNAELKDSGDIYKTVPLYTAPRELSDKEIDEVALNNFEGVGRLIYMVQGNVKGDDFKQAIRSIARAILKKASEE